MTRYRSSGSERGFSLIEVILVVLIMGILASVAAQKFTGAVEQSRFDATREEMDRIALAVAGDPSLTSGGVRSSFGYVGDVGSLPANLDALVANPGGYTTWKGPYLSNDFQQNPNDYKQDAWGATYGFTGITVTSTGSGSSVTKQIAPTSASLLLNSIVGSVTDGLDNAPDDSANSVTLALVRPNGTGGTTTVITHPSAGGSFSFASSVPVGNHLLRAMYHADTVVKYVSVLPSGSAVVNIRLPGNLWTPSGGGGSGGPAGLTYVAGSATTPGGNHHMSFQVQNNSGAAISLTSIRATYSPAIYFQTILLGGNQVFNNTNPRGASGDTKTFSAVTVNNGATLTIEYNTFKSCSSGNCGNAIVNATAFTILFSDGSSVNFTVP